MWRNILGFNFVLISFAFYFVDSYVWEELCTLIICTLDSHFHVFVSSWRWFKKFDDYSGCREEVLVWQVRIPGFGGGVALTNDRNGKRFNAILHTWNVKAWIDVAQKDVPAQLMYL